MPLGKERKQRRNATYVFISNQQPTKKTRGKRTSIIGIIRVLVLFERQ